MRKEVLKKGSLRRVLSMLLAIVMVAALLPLSAMTTYADEVSAPSAGTFWTNGQLREITGSETNAPYYATGTTFQKANFDGKTWYVIGKENIGGVPTLVLLSDSELVKSKYGNVNSYSEANNLRGTVNNILDAAAKAYVFQVTVNSKKGSEMADTDTTSYNYLYLPDAKVLAADSFTVGANDSYSIPISTWKNNNSSNGVTKLWLRSTKSTPSDTYAMIADLSGNNAGLDNMNVQNSIVPAFNLNLLSGFFASSAPAASSDTTADVTVNGSMTFRIADSNKIKSTVKYSGSGSRVSVKKSHEDSQDVYLCIQYKAGATDKIYTKKITSSGTIDLSSIGNLANAKIWVEMKSSDAKLVYASMATASTAVTGVSLNKSSTTLTVDGNETLTATVAPKNASDQDVKWTSSDTTVATVGETTGKVTAVAAGTATITVTTMDGSKTATCEVTVSAANKAVEDIDINRVHASLTVGESETYTVTTSPADATIKSVTWSSSNPAVATVDGTTGKVTAIAAGTTKIKVVVNDGIGNSNSNVSLSVVTPTPTDAPTPTPEPSGSPSVSPTASPSGDPSVSPTATPSGDPSVSPTATPSGDPSVSPTATPSGDPSVSPTATPSGDPTPTPSETPTPTVTPDSKPVTEKFSDVDANKWYAKADGPIQYVVDNGIMKGTGDGSTFEPEKDCTRTMMVMILFNAEGAPSVSGTNPFSDVSEGRWFYNAVIWASQNKVTEGYKDGRFGVEDNVSRQQMAKFLLNYATFKGYNVSDRADLSSYPDEGKISGWAVDAMKWANANGIIKGKNKDGQLILDPQGTASRAEVAQMIMNFQKKFGK